MLTASNARTIATGELSIILHKIEEAAYNRQLELRVDKHIKDGTLEVLRNLGYKIETIEYPIYSSNPYKDIIVSYGEYILISW